jgi:membrane protease YdiL (CAAX protease family)
VRQFSSRRLGAWLVLIGLLALVNYATRFAVSSSTANNRDVLYTYSAAISGFVFYAVFFAFLYAIAAVDTDELFALRAPDSWHRAAGLALAAFFGILAWSWVVSRIPLPQSPSKEQGLTPTQWEPQHAKAYALNFVVVALVAPFVEELAFRGVGYRLIIERVSRLATIVLVGVAFGLAHGLIEGLLVLVPFGSALAYLRDRTDSTLPGMAVHATFNALALIAAVTS